LRCRAVWEAVQRQAAHWTLPRAGYALKGWTIGAGPPLYFVNGFAGTAALHALVAWLLRDQYRSVLYDVELAGPNGPTTLADFTTDLLDAATLQGDATFSVYGSTFGGMVAVQAAAVAGDRVERLILQSVPIRGRLTPAEWLLARCCRRSLRPLAQFPLRIAVQTQNHRRWFPPLDPDRWSFFLETTGKLPTGLPARQALAWHGRDLSSLLPSITQPVLFVDTEGTGLRLSQSQAELREGLSQAREERLHSTGLHPYLTHPHRMVKLIQSFCPVECSTSHKSKPGELETS